MTRGGGLLRPGDRTFDAQAGEAACAGGGLQVRPAHLDCLRSQAARIEVGGPLLKEIEQPAGSVLIVEAVDRNAAETFAAGDPYRRGGVRARGDPGLVAGAGFLGELSGRCRCHTG